MSTRALVSLAGPFDYFRRRCWFFIQAGRINTDCPGHQKVVTKLYFNLVSDATLNASATTWKDYNIIGANIGSIANVYTFFQVLLSHPEVLPGYGFPSEEVPWLVSLANCDWRKPTKSIMESMVIDEDVAGKTRQPKDWFRRSIADTLATMALDFVFFHELTHLRRGHLHFLQAEVGADRIDESWPGGDSDVQEAEQAFELDADGGAMEITLGPWLDGGHVKGFRSGEAGPEEAIELWTFAVAFLFLLFDPFPQPVLAYREKDHPHPMVRLSHIYFQASHIAQRRSLQTMQSFQDYWWAALNHVGEVSALLNMPSSVMYSITRESTTETINEQQRLVKLLMALVDKHDSLKI